MSAVMPEADQEVSNGFQLQLPIFEGPLALLLYLIEKEELDITAVSLVQVTDQYLKHLRSGEQIDAAALAEFIVIGAKLIYIKSKALLPRPATEDEEEEDLGDDLVRRLREYKRFKEVAGLLRNIEEDGLRAYPRMTPPTGIPLPTGLKGVTLDLLLGLVQEAIAKKDEEEEPEQGVVEVHEVTVDEKVTQLSTLLRRDRRVSFRGFISACRSRMEIIVSFMAVLELIKSIELVAEQDEVFGDIALVAVSQEAPV